MLWRVSWCYEEDTTIATNTTTSATGQSRLPRLCRHQIGSLSLGLVAHFIWGGACVRVNVPCATRSRQRKSACFREQLQVQEGFSSNSGNFFHPPEPRFCRGSRLRSIGSTAARGSGLSGVPRLAAPTIGLVPRLLKPAPTARCRCRLLTCCIGAPLQMS